MTNRILDVAQNTHPKTISTIKHLIEGLIANQGPRRLLAAVFAAQQTWFAEDRFGSISDSCTATNSVYSITASARARSIGGNARPSAPYGTNILEGCSNSA